MSKSSQSSAGSLPTFRKGAEEAARTEQMIQREIDKKKKDASAAKKKNGRAMQAGARIYPEPPLPGQHLKKPGEEAELELQRRCTTRPTTRVQKN